MDVRVPKKFKKEVPEQNRTSPKEEAGAEDVVELHSSSGSSNPRHTVGMSQSGGSVLRVIQNIMTGRLDVPGCQKVSATITRFLNKLSANHGGSNDAIPTFELVKQYLLITMVLRFEKISISEYLSVCSSSNEKRNSSSIATGLDPQRVVKLLPPMGQTVKFRHLRISLQDYFSIDLEPIANDIWTMVARLFDRLVELGVCEDESGSTNGNGSNEQQSSSSSTSNHPHVEREVEKSNEAKPPSSQHPKMTGSHHTTSSDTPTKGRLDGGTTTTTRSHNEYNHREFPSGPTIPPSRFLNSDKRVSGNFPANNNIRASWNYSTPPHRSDWQGKHSSSPLSEFAQQRRFPGSTSAATNENSEGSGARGSNRVYSTESASSNRRNAWNRSVANSAGFSGSRQDYSTSSAEKRSPPAPTTAREGSQTATTKHSEGGNATRSGSGGLEEHRTALPGHSRQQNSDVPLEPGDTPERKAAPLANNASLKRAHPSSACSGQRRVGEKLLKSYKGLGVKTTWFCKKSAAWITNFELDMEDSSSEDGSEDKSWNAAEDDRRIVMSTKSVTFDPDRWGGYEEARIAAETFEFKIDKSTQSSANSPSPSVDAFDSSTSKLSGNRASLRPIRRLRRNSGGTVPIIPCIQAWKQGTVWSPFHHCCTCSCVDASGLPIHCRTCLCNEASKASATASFKKPIIKNGPDCYERFTSSDKEKVLCSPWHKAFGSLLRANEY